MSLLIVPLLYPDLAEYRISQTTFQNNFRFADNSYLGSVLHAKFPHTPAEVAPLHGIRA
jgi:hypothetical protein